MAAAPSVSQKWTDHAAAWDSFLVKDSDQKSCASPVCEKKARARGLCEGHLARWRRDGDPRLDVAIGEGRFWSKVVKGDGCWRWLGYHSEQGYAKTSKGYVHRLVYQELVGPIPAGLQLDHFACDNTSCVNPHHVRPVTVRENAMRSNNRCSNNAAKTNCVHGHEYTPQNTGRDRAGDRYCVTCAHIRSLSRSKKAKV